MAEKLSKAYSMYGASMGRRSDLRHAEEGEKVRLHEIRLDSGGYDSGGAYWGHDIYNRMWRMINNHGEALFVRAKSRWEAWCMCCEELGVQVKVKA